MTIGIGLRKGPRGRGVLMSKEPLWWKRLRGRYYGALTPAAADVGKRLRAGLKRSTQRHGHTHTPPAGAQPGLQRLFLAGVPRP